MIEGGDVLQLLEEGLCPFSEGVRQAWGPENTFMWQRQGAGAFSVTPRLSPGMAAVGGSPSAGLSSEPTRQAGTDGSFPSSPQPVWEGCSGGLGKRELRQLIQFVQRPPKAAEARGDSGPLLGHLPR